MDFLYQKHCLQLKVICVLMVFQHIEGIFTDISNRDICSKTQSNKLIVSYPLDKIEFLTGSDVRLLPIKQLVSRTISKKNDSLFCLWKYFVLEANVSFGFVFFFHTFIKRNNRISCSYNIHTAGTICVFSYTCVAKNMKCNNKEIGVQLKRSGRHKRAFNYIFILPRNSLKSTYVQDVTPLPVSWNESDLTINWKSEANSGRTGRRIYIIEGWFNNTCIFNKTLTTSGSEATKHNITVPVEIFSNKITVKIKWDTAVILLEEVYTPPATPLLKIVKYVYTSPNQVDITISAIENLDLNQTHLYVLAINDSNLTPDDILKNINSYNVYMVITHDDKSYNDNLAINAGCHYMHLNLLRNNSIQVELQEEHFVRLLLSNTYQNISRYTAYDVIRLKSSWAMDLLRAGGLVLLLLSPTLTYVLLKYVQILYEDYKERKAEAELIKFRPYFLPASSL